MADIHAYQTAVPGLWLLGEKTWSQGGYSVLVMPVYVATDPQDHGVPTSAVRVGIGDTPHMWVADDGAFVADGAASEQLAAAWALAYDQLGGSAILAARASVDSYLPPAGRVVVAHGIQQGRFYVGEFSPSAGPWILIRHAVMMSVDRRGDRVQLAGSDVAGFQPGATLRISVGELFGLSLATPRVLATWEATRV